MRGGVVIKGHLKWIIPLLIIIASSAFTLYCLRPATEYFTSEVKVKKTNIQKILSEDKKELKEIEKRLEELKNKLKEQEDKEQDKEKEDKEQDKEKEDKEQGGKEGEKVKEEINISVLSPEISELKIKEGFQALESTGVEVLRKNWRKEELPRTLEPYNGEIQGYNCGLYSKFTLEDPKSCVGYGECNAKYITPSKNISDPKEYIFPGRPINKTGCVKHTLKPNILEYETDVNQKILEHESMNILPDYNPKHIEHLERPQFMYHRRDGTDDPIITDENRFEVGKLNAFRKKSSEYSL